MVSTSSDKWVRIFDITDTSRHRKGFTLYKIISMLYQETCPDAVTKLTVWKRFNDFKKLHREMKVLHKNLNLEDKYPSLPGRAFFNRFDEELIQSRRGAILGFLEYIASHSKLYTSKEFVKFFESSYTPIDQINSNISSIRADLNLPKDPEVCGNNSDDDQTNSDTDSINTLSSATTDFSFLKYKPSSIGTSNPCLKSPDSISITTASTIDSITLLEGQAYPSPPSTPGIYSENYVQYIIDASVHVNMAVDLENERKYEEAYSAYKTAIDILLKYGKEDKNYDRKQMVRYKTEKYLIKAEKLYNMYLSKEMQTLQEISEIDENTNSDEQFVHRPISDLYKYKVIKLIGSGMMVLHSETQQIFYLKVVRKRMNFFNDNLILPECVPYMVKLHNYYNCENALFIVLEYTNAKKLTDYIQNQLDKADDVFLTKQEFESKLEGTEASEPESEHSYSDLICDYTKNKTKKLEDTVSYDSTDSFEKISAEDIPSFEHPTDSTTENRNVFSNQRKMSEVSSFDDDSILENYSAPEVDIKKWAAQLLLALDKLHALGIICYDLQLHNLLIDENEDLVLTYMCNLNEPCDVFGNVLSSFTAPELYTFLSVTNAVDWWSYGVILYELLVGMPLSSLHPAGISNYTNLKIPKYVSSEGRSLLKQLLVVEPTERLGFGPNGCENLKSHPFFNKVSWSDLLVKYNC